MSAGSASLRPPPEDDVERRLEQLRRERTSTVDAKTLRWLALLPEWTDSLARDCGLSLDELERARRAGLCEARVVWDPSGGERTRFWMPTPTRSWLLGEWQTQPELRLEEDVAEIASSIVAAYGDGHSVSSGILRWAQLATAELDAPVVTGDLLSYWVDGALEKGDIAAARDWIFAGEWLSESLGARMQLAGARVRRRMNLHHRRAQDERYLERFVRRTEQIAELQRVAHDESRWASHFIGPGGVGKTMLMRFVTSQLDDNPFLSSTRVDFDYIAPSLPLENPAGLLLELGDGLAVGISDGGRESLFRSFAEAVTEAETARPPVGERYGVPPHNTPEFERALEAFSRFLQALPGPVALVLDTCEELAKLHPPGQKMQSISVTFEILQRLREVTGPDLKTIVAGRRWLTAEYANRDRNEAAPESVKAMEPFEFMELHDIQGFRRAEVRRYLQRAVDPDVGEEMVAAVCANTLDPSSAPATGEHTGDPDRELYSPNDVALIGGWLREDPGLDPKTLTEADFDAYVEARIIERLDGNAPEILQALPVVTLLERFDGATIRPFLGEDPATQERVLSGLIGEDWTHLEGGPDLDDIVIKVDEGLLPRLRAYYEHTRERFLELSEARLEAEKRLALLLERPPRTITVEGVDAALRVLPPVQAVSCFDRLSSRVAREPAWGWAQAVCERLLSPEREPILDPMLQSSVWTLYLAALRHRGTTVDLAPYWRSVTDSAHAHPDPDRGEALAARGKLGALTEAAVHESPDEAEAREALDVGRRLALRATDGLAEARETTSPRQITGAPVEADPDVAPALLAAVEALIDANEEGGAPIPPGVEPSLSRLHAAFEGSAPLQAHILALAGRLHALAGNRKRAQEAFDRVGATRFPSRPVEPLFADWVAPDSLRHRAMLELLRFRVSVGEESEDLLAHCEGLAEAGFGGTDAAQLLSFAIQVRLANGSVTEDGLVRAASFEDTVEGYELTAPAHRCAPLLFVSIAEGWMALGLAERALVLLTRRERLAVSRRTDEHVTRAAALALVRVYRRLRLRERLALVAHSTVGDDELREEALAAGALIAGLQPSQKRRAVANDHATWRSLTLLHDLPDPDLLVFDRSSDPEESARDALRRALDRLESEMVLQRLARIDGSPRLERAQREARRLLGGRLTERPLGDPLANEATRLRLRAWALLGPAADRPECRERQRAQLAVEEGELLAMRVPDRAIPLLELAEEGFDATGDVHGAFVATMTRAIAEIHAARGSAARGRKGEVLARYAALRAGRRSLPSPEHLGSRERAAKEIPPNEPWRAWLWRLSYYLQWANDQLEDSSTQRAEGQFGSEFALRPAKAAAPRTIAPKARARTRRIAAAAPDSRWLVILPLPLLFATGVLVLGPGPAALILGSLVAIPAAIELLGPRLPWRILPVEGFEIWLLGTPRSASRSTVLAGARAAVMPLGRRLPMRLYLGLVSVYRGFSVSFLSVAPDPGARMKSVPKPIAQALRPRLWGGYPPLRLGVAPDLAQISWERRLCETLARRPDWHPRRSPEIWRIHPTGFARAAGHWPEQLSAICAPRWRQFLERSADGDVVWLDRLGAAEGWLPQEEDERLPHARARATIALGSPVATRAGWRLRLDDDEMVEGLREHAEHRLQQLISPDRLVGEGTVVVIVGRPDGLQPAADRQMSDGLRALANEVVWAGAHGVLTVPSLPPGRSSEALRMLVERIGAWPGPPTARQLRDVARKLRIEIFEDWKGKTPEDEGEREQRTELALDVCLYAPAERQGRR